MLLTKGKRGGAGGPGPAAGEAAAADDFAVVTVPFKSIGAIP